MRATGLRMKMDMRRSVCRASHWCHEARLNARPSFPEEIIKGGSINELRAATSVQSAESRVVTFGPFTFDRANRLLWKEGVEVSLPPRVLGVLALLVERPGELVTKQELIGAVWRDAFVTETSLAEAISVLRQTLGDDPQRPTYIQTLHRRGYRFIAGERAVAPAPVAARPEPEPEPRLSLLVPWLITLFSILTAGTAVWRYLDTEPPPPRQPVRLTLALPAGLTVAPTGAPIAVSNDGSLVAIAACKDSGCGIYLRPLSQAEPTLVAGTSGGAAPFFSPDGLSLGYFADGRLHTIALGGGSPATIADAPEPLGAVWLQDGQIVLARSAREGLFIVGADGRNLQALTTPRTGEGGHRWPSVLPDGSAIVFTVASHADRADQDYAGIVSTRTRVWGRLLDDVAAARVDVPGYLVAQRGQDLIAGAIDGRTHAIAGLPVAVTRTPWMQPGPRFAMSAAGTLVVAAPGDASLQVALDWTAELRRLVPPPLPLPR
jgi:DNA-binding winged helix-turn-helix (wHTH) protein